MLPTTPGIPWWGAVLFAGGLTAVGAMIDTSGSTDLGGMFKFLFVVGVLGAVLLVRNRALFTAAAQPPLLMVVIGGIALYFAQSGQHKSGLKQIALQVVIPIAKMFPMMAWTFVLVVAIALGRYYLSRRTHPFAGGSHADTGSRKTTRSQAARDKAKARREERATATRRVRDEPAKVGAVTAAAPVGAGAGATRHNTRQRPAADATTRRSAAEKPRRAAQPGDRSRVPVDRHGEPPVRSRSADATRAARREHPADLPPRSRAAAPRPSRDTGRYDVPGRRASESRYSQRSTESPRPGREMRDREPYGDPRRRDDARRAASRREGFTDPRAGEARHRDSDVPAHPSPRVRYRD
ncbi:DUF6542 domain-containing protein [Jongsikchunia kroppenstedtii]|uniref:DUF6542 domain-containing protein n=1 Tax=Jongsikchunia kroppenstedtii TaxID=1121721 RepID=UPI00036BE78B|nr:DUF6542 domain-containing protein [Jongsikchunia kroppenstedtii]